MSKGKVVKMTGIVNKIVVGKVHCFVLQKVHLSVVKIVHSFVLYYVLYIDKNTK